MIKNSKKYILGISGFIGSGKSTVALMFEKKGALWIDADQVVNELYQPGAGGYEKIKSFFGDDYLLKNSKLNRRKLAKVVFEDPQKLKILHSLIHPLVTAEIQKKINHSTKRFIVLEATYFEKKFLRPYISSLLWIETSKDIAYKRISKSRELTNELFNKIYRLQTKPENIDHIIENNESKEELEKSVDNLMTKVNMHEFE